MPIYTYECPTDGVTDILSRTYDTSDTYWCPTCGQHMAKCVTLPGLVEIKQDWNEKANEYQTHGPYHQAKSQLENINRRAAEGGESHSPITEEAIQVGAKGIDEATRNLRPDLQQQQIQRIRQDQRDRRTKQNA